MKNTTPTEFLIHHILHSEFETDEEWQKVFEQAKEMEKQQIRIAYSSKCTNESCDYSKKVCSCGLNYYNETFKQ